MNALLTKRFLLKTAIPSSDQWTLFFLSLLVPGAGQLRVGSWTCLPWFMVSFLAYAGITSIEPFIPSASASATRIVTLLLLGLVSGEQARRLLEPGSRSNPTPWKPTPGNRVKVHIERRGGRRIAATIDVTIARSAEEVWRRVSDLPRFLKIDLFHERVILMRPRPAAGVDIAILHHAFGRRFWRFGRILRWSDKRSYAFSDLSAGNRLGGLPHVFFISVEPIAEGSRSCRLKICIRGKWTIPWLPTCVGRVWIGYVCRQHGRLLKKTM